MSDAFIFRRGGAGKPKLIGLQITSPPAKTSYIDGETFDPSGLTVAAYIGGGIAVEIDDYTCSPREISENTQHITISYTLNGVTKTATQAVSVTVADATLANNSWAVIAAVAASGKASSKWKVGDAISVDVGGTSRSLQIVGFDHDDLNETDARYGDASYNGGSGKAAITFRFSQQMTTQYAMNSTATIKGGWDSSNMRKTVMPQIKGNLPADLQSVLRTVSKFTSEGTKDTSTGAQASSTLIASADTLFLLSVYECTGSVAAYDKPTASGEGTQYALFAAGNSPNKSYVQWTRSPQGTKYFATLDASSGTDYSTPTSEFSILPGLCI